MITRQSHFRRGLVGHFKMADNAANLNVADSSRKGLTATSVRNTSMMSISDRAAIANRAFQYDGTSDYGNQQRITEIDSSDYIAISCWLKCATFTGGLAKYFWHWDFRTDASNKDLIQLGVLPSDYATEAYRNKFYLVCFWNTSYTTLYISAATVVDNTWHHVLAVGGAAYNALYVDGVADTSGTYSAGSAVSRCHIAGATHPYNYTVFGAFDAASGFYSGILDDLRIWNRRLNLVDAQRLAGVK